MNQLLAKFTPTDVIVLVALVGAFTLRALGVNHITTVIIDAILASYIVGRGAAGVRANLHNRHNKRS